MAKSVSTNNLKKLINNLMDEVPQAHKRKLKKISVIDRKYHKKILLMEFLSMIYNDASRKLLSIIKKIFIELPENSEEADLVTDYIIQYLNHPIQFRRIAALDIVYKLYHKNFSPSREIAKELSIHLVDCISVSTEKSPKIKLSRAYNLLKDLSNVFPEETFPPVYDSLKEKTHPCRAEFMELLGNVTYDGFLWVERLTPHIMDFLSSTDERLILSVSKTIKSLFPCFPNLMVRFMKPLMKLMNSGSEKIQIQVSEIILTISKYHKKHILDLISLLVAYIKRTDRAKKAVLITGRALNNLLKGEELKLKKTISRIMESSKPLDEKKTEQVWKQFSIKLLEQAMITQQRFSIKEFLWLFGPEVFKSVPGKLVLNIHSERGSFQGIYHEKNWLTSEGKLKFAHTNQIFTIAHPLDIFFAGQITLWQKIIMEKKIKQPFKQVFRALFSLHMDEITALESLRFSSQQLISKKAKKAFLEEDFILKSNYAAYLWKDLHIESRFVWDRENTRLKGITVTGQLEFHKILDIKTGKTDRKKIPLWQIDPRIFSETIRKLEQIISKGIFRKTFY